jgi:hypothetical protein
MYTFLGTLYFDAISSGKGLLRRSKPLQNPKVFWYLFTVTPGFNKSREPGINLEAV